MVLQHHLAIALTAHSLAGGRLAQRHVQEFERYMKGADDRAPRSPVAGGVAYTV
ncbi:hypothetical protein [Rubrivivax gelatinosus]|uniref:Uncharacterized protein n=1 Tax=Rubrivivax gelatinosus (strain NBRC 100245 / IL144) TaxID=983917 RepID=I0HRP1_RUBGI|nr:hypothetical protein [Rubrivivax gelatinosus]BAL95678.1 hypothetical protein RGE_23370 [Rubrivivax gelatinosus IL144]